MSNEERSSIGENLTARITTHLGNNLPGVNKADLQSAVQDAVKGLRLAEAEPPQTGAEIFQEAVGLWLVECFGRAIAGDIKERCYRFQEEANELVQSLGLTREEAHQLVDYTWDRPVGETEQELGGVMITLAALCHATNMDMETHALNELSRINQSEVIERIRQKQKSKPHQSPLPGAVA